VFKPLFREAEMRGTFFAPFIIWFLALGPVFVVLVFFFWALPKDRLRSYLFASIGPFLWLQFFREGTDHFQNAVAIAATFLPFAIVAFTELLRKFTVWPDDPEYRGCAAFLVTATIGFLLFGGFVCPKRLAMEHINYFRNEDFQLVEWVGSLPGNAVLLGRSKLLNPLALTGRQQFIGDHGLLWNAGIKIAEKLDQVDRLVQSQLKDDWKSFGVQYVVEERGQPFQLQVSVTRISENSKYKLAALRD
jgi:hypothetical protein